MKWARDARCAREDSPRRCVKDADQLFAEGVGAERGSRGERRGERHRPAVRNDEDAPRRVDVLALRRLNDASVAQGHGASIGELAVEWPFRDAERRGTRGEKAASDCGGLAHKAERSGRRRRRRCAGRRPRGGRGARRARQRAHVEIDVARSVAAPLRRRRHSGSAGSIFLHRCALRAERHRSGVQRAVVEDAATRVALQHVDTELGPLHEVAEPLGPRAETNGPNERDFVRANVVERQQQPRQPTQRCGVEARHEHVLTSREPHTVLEAEALRPISCIEEVAAQPELEQEAWRRIQAPSRHHLHVHLVRGVARRWRPRLAVEIRHQINFFSPIKIHG